MSRFDSILFRAFPLSALFLYGGVVITTAPNLPHFEPFHARSTVRNGNSGEEDLGGTVS